MTQISASMHLSKLVVPTLFALVAGATLTRLGWWQLQKLEWKNHILHQVSERVSQPPSPIPDESQWPELEKNGIEYRHWRVEGVFDHSKEIRSLTNLPANKGQMRGPGYWVMTPLVRPDGSTVLINRGFVPQNREKPETRPEGQIAGPVTITGLARWTEERNFFTPADAPEKGHWFTRDIEKIALAKKIDRVAPFFIDAEQSAPGGLPLGGETILSFPNNHFQYALTWFGLAIGLAGVYFAFVWQYFRRRHLSAVKETAE